MNEEKSDMPELACPLCGYNIAVQVLRRGERCSECGFVLPEFAPEPLETVKERWDEMAEAVRRRNRRGFSDGLQHPWRGLRQARRDNSR